MKDIDWDNLRVFAAVARAGGLSAAATQAKQSPATLGRRIAALEHTLRLRLFDRRRDGYALTAHGEALLPRALAAETAVLSIERWATASNEPTTVRVATGAWTGAFLAANARFLAGISPPIGLEILSGVGHVDLTRQEAELGIRNRRPSTPGLAGQKLGPVAFAVFGPPALTREWSAADEQSCYGNFDWVAFRTAGSTVPSAAWLDRRLTRPPIVCLSDPRAVLDASAAGIGLCVLPCFVGDSDHRLRRASGVIDDLTHEQWLVSHDDHRHNRPVRQIADRIKRLMKERRRLFAGAVPIGVRTD